jgi:hypothetical protein
MMKREQGNSQIQRNDSELAIQDATIGNMSTEAEYVSLSMGAQETIFIQMLLDEIAFCTLPGILLEDNMGAIYLVKNQQVGQRTEHINVLGHFI